MRIRERILLGFVALGVVIGIAGYISFSLSQKTLEETIGRRSIDLARTTMNHVLDIVRQRIDELRRHGRVVGGHKVLARSNHLFGAMTDINDVIRRREADWIAATPSDQSRMITDNALSHYLRRHLECRDYYVQTHGHRVFGECFVTNAYGVNVAQTRKTSDYDQSDETWWQRAKSDGTYVGQIQYDRSAELYVVDLAVRLHDGKGAFAGVIKAVLNIQQLIEAVDRIKLRSEYATTRLRLVSNGVVIYDTRKQTLLASLKPSLLNAINRNAGRAGYMDGVGDAGRKILLAFYRMDSSYEPETQNTLMLIDHEKAEILAPIARLKLKLFCITVFLFLVSALCAWLVADDISRPLVALKQMAQEISRGNLPVRSYVTGPDEIGQLAATFDRMSEDLRNTLDHLENEIIVRQRAEEALAANNRELLTTLRRVKYAKRQLEEFAHIAAHDIKSPVRAIGTLTDWIMSNQESHVDTEVKTYLDQLKRKAKHLNDLSDSIIQYCEITADHGNEPVNCHRLVCDLIDCLSIPPSVRVSVNGYLPTVSHVPGQLKLLFSCLIDNAVRHCTEAGGNVTIECRETDTGWLFSVGDSGPGIEDRYHHKIFKMFQKLESDSDRLGAGLALAKKIVESHDGEIWVQSEPGNGSTFFFTILYEDEPATLPA